MNLICPRCEKNKIPKKIADKFKIFCTECGGWDFKEINGENVCESCGFVFGGVVHIPFMCLVLDQLSHSPDKCEGCGFKKIDLDKLKEELK